MDERTDEDLIAAYMSGEENAFSLLTARHLKSVYSFAYRLIGDQHAAEDVTQETFLKIWKAVKKYDPISSRFKTWMLRITRNTVIDFLRKRKNLIISHFEDEEGQNPLIDTITDESKLPDELFADKEDVETLTRAVDQLTLKHREVLTLHYTNGLTFEEISNVLEEPQNTVKSRHHRALLTLRKLMADNAPNNY
jgi:RNA polymerase sigma-70 factor (ECF subfamily)